MNCQHCQNELTSKRAKQCPACATLKNDAYKLGTYACVTERMTAAAAQGLTGEAFHAHMRGEAQTAKNEMYQEKDRVRKEREAREEVAYQNRKAGRHFCTCCHRYVSSTADHDPFCEFGIAG